MPGPRAKLSRAEPGSRRCRSVASSNPGPGRKGGRASSRNSWRASTSRSRSA